MEVDRQIEELTEALYAVASSITIGSLVIFIGLLFVAMWRW